MAGSPETLKTIELPCDGVWHLTANGEQKPTFVFVHHYGGNSNSTRRHVELVNKLGYNAVSFNLSCNQWPMDCWPWDSHLNLGFMHIWVEEIENLLNKIPGRKILFGFSSPSGSIPMAVLRRSALDVDAMIFDGGPFMNTWSMVLPALFNTSPRVGRRMRFFAVAFNQLLFGRHFPTRCKETLQKLPSDLPILSIRSWKDDVIPSPAIERYFSLNPNLNVEVINLPAGQHLEGLKTNPDEYAHRLEQFLKSL